MVKLDETIALTMMRKLAVIPYFPASPDAQASIVQWFILNGGDERLAREIVKRAQMAERWGGLDLLEEIKIAIHTELQGEWKPAYSYTDYEPPKCEQCGDRGYWRPPEKIYELCSCAAGRTDFARAFVRVENERLKLPPRVPRQLAPRSRRELVEQNEARKEAQAERKPITQADIDRIIAGRKKAN